MAKRKKSQRRQLSVDENAERLIRARNLFANAVTNHAAGLVIPPIVSEKISTHVQKGSECSVRFYKQSGYYVSEIVDPSIKEDIDELHNSMLLQKVGSRRKSTVVFNTMSKPDSILLNDHRKILKIHKKIQIDGGKNQLKKIDLTDSLDDNRRKILIERIEKHLQKQIIAELKVDVPADKRIMTVSLLETQPSVQYTESVDGNLITKVDSVCMLMLFLCFLLYLIA